MMGLIRKDMYCLRKNLVVFFGITIGVIIISVLFIISSRYGNVANMISEMAEESGMSQEMFASLFKIPVWVTLFIPVSFTSMIVECFKEDRKAGFARCMFSLPVSEQKIVGSRYASCFLFAVLGLAGSLLASVFISLSSEEFLFTELCGYVLCFSAVLLIYMSFVLFMLYLFGAERADLIQCAPFAVLLLITIVAFDGKMLTMEMEVVDQYLQQIMEAVSDFMIQKAGLIFLIALFCMAISFWGSCMMIKKRRGNI